MVTPILNFESRRVPSYLKGLIDNRARADGHVHRLQVALAGVQTELDRALAQRESCDALLKSFSDNFPTDDIGAVRGWMGQHGKRGSFLEAIKQLVSGAGPGGITTSEIGSVLIGQFQLVFATPVQRGRWQRNCVTRRLNELKHSGQVEALHDHTRPANTSGRWRLKVERAASLDSLADLARSLGVEVEVEVEADE
jgi:hypothetical protein